MRPFLLDGITGVKKISHKLIILLKFLFCLGSIPLLCDRFLITNKGKPRERSKFHGVEKTSARMFS
ncbi:Uncharacterised protein [Cronobacter sakazakii]|nr:hypothetical protein CSK29544_02110 [Cronobacter sakazakii]SPW12861.1 Uncharacterised protein [Cronobacter sakazakii]